MDAHKKIKEVYRILMARYGPQGWWPIIAGKRQTYSLDAPAGDFLSLEICLGAILTQNTNWENAKTALKSLDHHELFSIERLLEARDKEIAFAIKSAGYYNQKTRYLKNLAVFLKNNPFRKLRRRSKDRVRRELLEVGGIGPETADCILLYALEKLSFVVDAYTLRIFSYLDIINAGAGYNKVQKLFESALPPDLEIFQEYHALIVRRGKEFYSKKPYGADDRLLTAARMMA